MKLNCVVVDDSSIQRMIIAKLVNNHQHLHLIGDFSNAIEAKNCMSIHTVDLIFLDIEMPVISGFDFLDGLKTKPQIIFITSKAEYAMKAFDYDATDYLQKPIALERFNASVKRAMDLHLLKSETHEEDGEHIFIKSNLKKLKIFRRANPRLHNLNLQRRQNHHFLHLLSLSYMLLLQNDTSHHASYTLMQCLAISPQEWLF